MRYFILPIFLLALTTLGFASNQPSSAEREAAAIKAQAINNQRLEALRSYTVGQTTEQQFEDDGWVTFNGVSWEAPEWRSSSNPNYVCVVYIGGVPYKARESYSFGPEDSVTFGPVIVRIGGPGRVSTDNNLRRIGFCTLIFHKGVLKSLDGKIPGS